MEYFLSLLAVPVFSVTGVLAANNEERDIFGLVVVAVITALGGGTLRDITLNVTPFWFSDFNHVFIAVLAAVVAFAVFQYLQGSYRLLLYLDAFGVALYGVQAIDKTLAMGLGAPVAVIMGLLTGIAGGIIRDVLCGRPNLLASKELYATPIMLGCIVYVLLLKYFSCTYACRIIAICSIFTFRALSIRFDLMLPKWLVLQKAEEP